MQSYTHKVLPARVVVPLMPCYLGFAHLSLSLTVTSQWELQQPPCHVDLVLDCRCAAGHCWVRDALHAYVHAQLRGDAVVAACCSDLVELAVMTKAALCLMGR